MGKLLFTGDIKHWNSQLFPEVSVYSQSQSSPYEVTIYTEGSGDKYIYLRFLSSMRSVFKVIRSSISSKGLNPGCFIPYL